MHYQTHFPPTEFAQRRAQIFHAIGNQAVAVLPGAAATGAFDLFRQTNDFYYLCGVEVPHAYLLLDGRTQQTTLYLPPHDAKHERSEGAQLHADAPELVCQLTGVDVVKPHAALREDVRGAATLYTRHKAAEGKEACQDTLRYAAQQAAADPWDGRPSPEAHFYAKLEAFLPHAERCDLCPLLESLRLIKSERELALMRRAGELSAAAVVAAIRSSQPGLMEYHLGAVPDYVYLAGGANGPGYRPIIAGGDNIWNAHYFRNNCPLKPGELVLMDYAPDCGNYTSDIGRMWPVNGRYSPTQRELYGFVVEYHKVLLQIIRPGKLVRELAAEGAERIRPTLETWPFSKPAYRAAAAKMVESEVAFTHPVGMAVHDVGTYREEPLQPGFVFALDPQLWVPEERLYIRVEDTVAITATGVESHTAAAPLELDEVEALVGCGGMLSTFPPQ